MTMKNRDTILFSGKGVTGTVGASACHTFSQGFEDELYVESRCKQCGRCCGSTDGDPCEHLKRNGASWFCEIYGNRLGPHKTVGGMRFRCVTIKEIIETIGGHAECAYVREYLRRAAQGQTRTGAT